MPTLLESYGNRPDGTAKGRGFYGEVKRPNGGISTELSVGVNLGGKEVTIPTMVPGLTAAEMRELMTNEGMPSEAIVRKAAEFAKQRQAQGLPFFAGPEEQPVALPPGYQQATQGEVAPRRWKGLLDFMYPSEPTGQTLLDSAP